MRLSPHFDSDEFACRHCGRSEVTDELVMRLERLRAIVGRPLVVVSGFRCPQHNRAVGGAKRSRHLSGEAADLEVGYARVSEAAHAGFLGIGAKRGWATHVDVRKEPARWQYP